jgi:hypothetical protein
MAELSVAASLGFISNPSMPSRDKLSEFGDGSDLHITGDERSEDQIFLDHLFQASSRGGGLKEAAATFESRRSKADGNDTIFARLVW